MIGQSQYSEAVVASMERIFGPGFLSPGGPGEVARVLDGWDLAGLKVLDWGCGVGGATMALATERGADDVLGLDIDAGNLARATARVAQAGLAGRIGFKLVAPGPMPLPDGSFDLIFTKEALCHIADKAPVFADCHRVLRPGGSFVGSDWMTGGERPASAAYRAWDEALQGAGLEFTFTSLEDHRRALEGAGFEAVEIIDDTAWTLAEGRGYLARIDGPERDALADVLGSEGLAVFIQRCQARVDALANGDLRRCHMRARKAGA